MFSRVCALKECAVEFQTDNPRKTHCSTRHSNLNRARAKRARDRKRGGGNGGGNGGGGMPMLFDELVPIDPHAIVLTDTCYRTPAIERKPVESVRPAQRRKAA
jgi:hypothetical protein